MNPKISETPKVLLVTDVIFWNRGRGSAERIQTMFEHLRSYAEVVVCFVGELTIADWNQASRQLGCELIGPGKPGKVASLVAGQAARLKFAATEGAKTRESQQQVTLNDCRSDVISDFVFQFAHDHQPDVVLLQYVTMGYLCEQLTNLDEPPLLIIDTHDVMHLRRNAFENRNLQHWLDIDLDEEAAALSKADVVLAIQEREASMLGQMLPDKQICLAKHAAIEVKMDDRAPWKDKDQLVLGFVTSRGTANQASLSDFLRYCWPQIRNGCHQNISMIVGGNLEATDLAIESQDALESLCDGVRFTGPFRIAADFYGQVDLVINPAQISSGMKIKSLEALAHSVPLVATPAGIAGLESAIGICAEVGEDWPQFAAHVCRLFDDRVKLSHMSENCALILEKEFAPDVVFAELKQIIMGRRGRA